MNMQLLFVYTSYSDCGLLAYEMVKYSWKYLYMPHSRQVTGCSKIMVPTCQTVWCHDPDNYDLSFHAVKTWDLMMFVTMCELQKNYLHSL